MRIGSLKHTLYHISSWKSNICFLKKALAEHRRLIRLFNDQEIHKSLGLIEEELAQHIRFEERILFKEIQKIATAAQLNTISKIHNDEKFRDNSDDPFWA